MPIVSQAQRGLMYAAAAKPGGVGGVSRKVAKEFVASDKPGKLPARVEGHAAGGAVEDFSNSTAHMGPRSGRMYARGGKITEVAGKPIGKDDGLIAAQRGEYVIRRAAVKKLGTKVLDEVNKGRLPSDRLYGSKKVARHG